MGAGDLCKPHLDGGLTFLGVYLAQRKSGFPPPPTPPYGIVIGQAEPTPQVCVGIYVSRNGRDLSIYCTPKYVWGTINILARKYVWGSMVPL
jgi:hypothetical protein